MERRQRILIALLATPYVLGGLWLLFEVGVGEVVFTVAGLSLLLLCGVLYFGYVGRRPSRR